MFLAPVHFKVVRRRGTGSAWSGSATAINPRSPEVAESWFEHLDERRVELGSAFPLATACLRNRFMWCEREGALA